MDPLTALSVAGTIVQFVDFGTKLLTHATELYQSSRGTLRSNDEIELVTTDLRGLITKLRQPCHSERDIELSSDDVLQQATFQKLCDEATKLAEELVERLDKLKVRNGKNKIWHSLKQAIEAVWSEKEMAEIRKRLLSFRDALETRVLFSIREKLDSQSIRTSGRFDALDQQTQQILLTIVESSGSTTNRISREIREQMAEQTIVFTQILSRLASFNRDGHLRVRSTMFEELRKEAEANTKNYEIVVDNIGEIVAAVEMLDVSDAAELRTRNSVQREILRRLRYATMSERYEEVLEAHAETFEWAFYDSTAEQQTWHNLSQWLRTDGGIYWVSGKAGSGKSTFMKHIYDDDRTREQLKEWAKDVPLCLATFFFWNSGSKEQKSQSGLLRSLLFQILEKHRELGPVMFPGTWTKLYRKAVNQALEVDESIDTESWSLKHLMVAFRALICQKVVPLKICFLVDGLDEFDGDHEEIVDLFQEISRFENIKVCLSSRPLVVFQRLLEGYPGLRLQNLTYPDIQRYIQDKLAGNSAFRKLAEEEEEAAPALVREIVEKADGVFLWVRLVVGSLLNGIRNRDEMCHLRARLRLLPKELEPLYSRLMDMVEPIYLVWVSKAFQILRNNRDLAESPFPEPSSRASGARSLDVLAFYLAMDSDLHLAKFKDLSKERLNGILGAKCKDTIVHLTARCAGFLEVSTVKRTGETGPGSFLRYFHRTAKDFLHSDACWPKRQTQTINTTFNPNVSMMQSCTMQAFINYKFDQEARSNGNKMAFAEFSIDIDPQECEIDTETTALAKDFMIYAHNADRQSETRDIQLEMIDRFNELLVPTWIQRVFPSLLGFASLLELAAIYNLRGYVRSKINQQSREEATRNACALLTYILPDRDCHASYGLPLPQVEMVSLLLHLGADPNTRIYSHSPWQNTVSLFTSCAEHKTDEINSWTDELQDSYNPYDTRPLQLRYAQIMNILSASGVKSPACRISIDYPGQEVAKHNAYCTATDFLAKNNPDEATPILHAHQCVLRSHTSKRPWKLPEEDDECEFECSRPKRQKRADQSKER
ncbi:hypothetical protein IFR04_008536 [Cadophora malorum]|uniref:NACHT domain-containing protein n=1 Tax=Cadophora malorum TaxID=108018 RepID=A0A8H7TES7_9HELO|nr:hypothetical protein IFR04_008536 [Cadophora malorum]